jgi:ERCC4-type nuclease
MTLHLNTKNAKLVKIIQLSKLHSMSDSVKIQIDNRESKLMKQLADQVSLLEVVQLPIADVIIFYNNLPVVAIERKSMADLNASIKDSRYKEQKERLLQAFPVDTIMYIIEGEWNVRLDEMAKGAIINTMLRDKIKVFMTPSLEGTAEFIVAAYKRIQKNGGAYINRGAEGGRGDYVDTLSQVASIAKKREMMDARNFSVLSLSLIPGVSKVIAKAIVDACGNIGDIAGNKVDGGNHIADRISEIKLQSGKRIGKTIAGRIASFLGAKN